MRDTAEKGDGIAAIVDPGQVCWQVGVCVCVQFMGGEECQGAGVILLLADTLAQRCKRQGLPVCTSPVPCSFN